MSLSRAQERELFLLFSALQEGYITDEQLDALNRWLATSPDARSSYITYRKMCGYLHGFQLAAGAGLADDAGACGDCQDAFPLESVKDPLLWHALAQDERNAPILAGSKKPDTVELISNVRDRKLMLKEARKKIPVSLWISLASMAAILLVIVFIYMNPPLGYEVATVTDSINLKSSSPLSLQKGSRLLVSSERVELQRGIIKLQTDKGVDVVIEAPAQFRFTNPDEIEMHRGRLVAVVPESGSGFSVRTNNSKIIDLGTEFGIYADFQGQTELHMFKGKTVVIAGQDRQPKQIIEVGDGRAVRLDASGQSIENISLQPTTFAHDIDSRTGLVWRHDDRYIDLADIIGGGNGTGNGDRGRAIQWDGQELLSASEMQPAGSAPQSYVPVRLNPFIDGIFVPNNKTSEPVKLSSDTAQLNLDEFIKQDSNGLITLMVLKKDSDLSSWYWFCSKEGAEGDPAKMPFIYFPKGSNGQPAFVTTADGQGADTYITNDVRNRYGHHYGASSTLLCRYIKNERLRVIYLRFDISQLQGDLSDAVLNLYLETGNRKRTLDVYGLKDGPADSWNEETLDYNTAPALKPTPLGNYEFDDSLGTRLGTFGVIDNQTSAKPVTIASDNAVKWTAPESMGRTAYAITNADSFRDALSPDRPVALRLGNQFCGTRDNPSILMHANAGITFDLESLRKEYGPLKSFTASCGLSPSLPLQADAESPSASFHVLLDGREVFSAGDITPEDDPQSIELELDNQQRYLTLITTQGTDRSIDNDLCLFVKPRINME